MEFHGIPPGCHRIPLKYHGNSIETTETMAIFCIPWYSMAFQIIPPGCHIIPLKCYGNNMETIETMAISELSWVECAEATFWVLQLIGWEVICKIVSNFYSPISPLFLIFCHCCTLLITFAHFTILQFFFDNFSSLLAAVRYVHNVIPRLATLLPLSPLYQHFNTLFGTLAHLSPQLFTVISLTILLVVYNFYHLLPLSQSFANFFNWHLNKHWLIWKVLQYTDQYTYLGKCEYNCKDISLLFGFWRIHLL